MSSRYNYPSTRDQYVQDHPHDPLDNDVLVLHFRRTDPHERNIHIASILNYACYGVVLGPDYKMISANYPGYVMERLEQTFGKACRDTAPYFGLFLQGCAGDIDPWLALTNDYRNVEATGGDVASGSIDAIGQIVLSSYTRDTPILFRSSRVKVVGAPGSQVLNGAEINTMRLGDKTALVTFPAEVFVELGQEVKQKAADRGFLYTFVCGYTNDAMGYVCTKRVCLWNGRLRNGS